MSVEPSRVEFATPKRITRNSSWPTTASLRLGGASGDEVDLRTTLRSVIDDLEVAHANPGQLRGIATGFHDLDRMTIPDYRQRLAAAGISRGQLAEGSSLRSCRPSGNGWRRMTGRHQAFAEQRLTHRPDRTQWSLTQFRRAHGQRGATTGHRGNESERRTLGDSHPGSTASWVRKDRSLRVGKFCRLTP